MQARYYADPWAKAHETAPYRYEYGAEDFYIYMTAHFAKHYYFGGSGIRSVADIYVFMKAHGKNLDRGYIKRELEKLGLYEFSRTAEALARHWFAGGEIGGEGKEMERTVLESGVYGTLDGRYLSQYRAIKAAHPKTARIRFVAARLFPPYPEMKTQYRVLSHFKAALPACYVHRIVTAAIFKRSKIKRILKNTKA
jgi:hypothetical protein